MDTPSPPTFWYPEWVLIVWAVASGIRIAVTSGVLAYIAKYLAIEKHFLIVLLADNFSCLVMSAASLVNHLLMLNGFYNLMSCYFNFFFSYFILAIGAIATALISVFRLYLLSEY